MAKRITVEGLGGKRRLDVAMLLAPMVEDEPRRRLLAKWTHNGGPLTIKIPKDRAWSRMMRRLERQARREERAARRHR